MYNFIDTTEVQESTLLPSEALQLNGEYIENLIEGYRTLNVTGREALSPELSVFETGARDGASLKHKRYPARTIIVRYQLIAKSNEAFREAYNQLGRILDVEDAEMIFADEQDKFYRGTPSLIGEVEAGRNSVVGEIEFYCADPFKYSVYEYEASAELDESSILIDYNGTYNAYPKLVAEFCDEQEVGEDGETANALTGAGDCGYVAFFTEDEKVVQLGDPEETDGDNSAYPASQTMMNQTFKTETAWGTTAKALWTLNNHGIPALATMATATGGVGMGVASYDNYIAGKGGAERSATLITVTSSQARNPVKYKVTAKTSNRTATSVKVAITVSGNFVYRTSSLSKGTILNAQVRVQGTWHNVILKNSAETWVGGKTYSKSISFTVSGLNEHTTVLSDIAFRVLRPDNRGDDGLVSTVYCSHIPVPVYETWVVSEVNGRMLICNDHGSGNAWHGCSLTRQIGADASGEVGAANFTFTYETQMCIANTEAGANQLGGFHCHLADASGNIVAGVRVVKTQKGTRQASLMLYVGRQKVHQVGIDISYYNKYFGMSNSSVRSSIIRKTGSNVYFNIGGYAMSFTDASIADAKVTNVTFMFERYGTQNILTYNGLFSAKFVKNNCNTYKDIPNKFSANDVLVADCNTGEIFLNGITAPELGALGNDWEGFYLRNGLNQIGFAYSDWVAEGYEPTFKVKYREVFL